MDRDTLVNVARTSLRTKLHSELADLLTEVIFFKFSLTLPSLLGKKNQQVQKEVAVYM